MPKHQSNEFFATARPVRLFFLVAIPGMISMLAMSIYSFSEGIFIGRFLGETAFAAINLAMPFVMINFSIADLIGVGSAVPISIALGKQDNERANNIFTCSIIMIFVAAAAMGLILFFGAPLIVRLLGAEGRLAEYAVAYIRVYAVMGPVSTLAFATDNYLRICGFVRGSMILNVAISALTILLLFVFIVIADLEVMGAAFASALSMALGASVAMLPFFFKKTILKLVKPRFSRGMVKQIITCGAPTFLNNVSGRVAAIVLNSALLRVGGETAVAAYSVLMYASDIIQPMLYGISDSVQPSIGYNWGARQLDRVRGIAKCAFIACGVVSLFGTAVMFFFPARIAGLFISPDDTALLDMTVHAMKIFCTAYLVRWFGFAVQGFYCAIEKPLPASILSISSAMVFPIILVLALSPFGLDGLWINLAGTSLIVSIMALFMLLRSQRSIKKDFE